MDFAWNTIREASRKSDDPVMKEAVRRASNHDNIKKQLIKFVSNAYII
jgi:hypothetical protein